MLAGYKDTEIGVIPVEWEVVKLDSLGKIITGSTPKTSNQDFYLSGTRLWASPSDLGKSKEVKTTNTKLSNLGFEQIRVLDKRSILITCIGSTIGKMGIAYEEMSSNQQINAITCNENNNPDFYYYVLFKIKDKIQKLAGTQAVPLLNKTDFSQIKVIKPPLKEQENIADILSTADDKIDAIALQIEKAETLKKGLLQNLLSEGIGHSEFKDSELGKIPESWKLTTIGKSSKNFDGQRVPLKSEDRQSIQGEYPYYGAQGIIDYVNDYIFDGRYLLVAEDGENVKGQKYDIAFVVSGKFWVNNHAHILQANDNMDLYFISSILNHINIIKYVTGTGQPKLNKAQLNSIKIPLPPLEEQKQIADILSTADEKLEVLRAKKEKYETLKKGLLQKLLSGEIRVGGDCHRTTYRHKEKNIVTY